MKDEQLLRYSRQIMLPQMDVAGQQKLIEATVLIVGMGGLGCPAAMYLAAAGVGHLIIADDDVSRFHARILYDNGSLWLQDSGSRNGVFVDDNRVTGHKALKVGHQIKIADHRFEVVWQADLEEREKSSEESEQKSGDKRWYWPFS